MDTLIEQLIRKMGLQDELRVIEKVTELLRILDVRSSQVSINVNEYGKIALCIDIAAAYLGVAIDKEQAIKLSGLREPQYKKHKQLFEQLLDMKKIVNIRDICLKLNLNEVKEKAEELLQLYKNVVGASLNYNDDFIHPQYAAMAVFQACKLTKRKVIKTKLMPFANLRPTQWLILQQRWEKFLETYDNDLKKSNNLKICATKIVESENFQIKSKKIDVDSVNKTDKMEDYDIWKQRMLQMAKLRLEQQTEN